MQVKLMGRGIADLTSAICQMLQSVGRSTALAYWNCYHILSWPRQLPKRNGLHVWKFLLPSAEARSRADSGLALPVTRLCRVQNFLDGHQVIFEARQVLYILILASAVPLLLIKTLAE